MIVSFSVENFRSFHGEATLSLVASNRLAGEHGDHAVVVPGSAAKVLRAAVVYGANGAGKSNLFKALSFLRSFALGFDKNGPGTGREAFRFGSAQHSPSVFDLQFVASGKFYRYGIKLDERRILEEWLVENTGNRENTIFQRGSDRDVALGGGAPDYVRLAALATVGPPPNQTFLSLIMGADLPPTDIGPDLASVIDWFRSTLTLIPPGESRASLWRKLSDDSSLVDFASEFLRTSSTGIDHLEIIKSDISRDDLSGFLSENRASRLIEDASAGRRRFVRAGSEGDTWIEADSGGFRLVRFQSAHAGEDGSTVHMDFSDESDGTRRLLELLPALHAMRSQGEAYFVDEIDRSMHPILVRRLLEFFLAYGTEYPGQLIFTTHESSLLDLDLLRRDEIWFAEKDHEQATRLYSLADFKVRNDLEIRKHYLQGRFGAIPFLGDPQNLMGAQSERA